MAISNLRISGWAKRAGIVAATGRAGGHGTGQVLRQAAAGAGSAGAQWTHEAGVCVAGMAMALQETGIVRLTTAITIGSRIAASSRIVPTIEWVTGRIVIDVMVNLRRGAGKHGAKEFRKSGCPFERLKGRL